MDIEKDFEVEIKVRRKIGFLVREDKSTISISSKVTGRSVLEDIINTLRNKFYVGFINHDR